MSSGIEAIIEQEEEAAAERIDERVRPLLRKLFAEAKAAHPGLLRVVFGNGTFLIDCEDATYLAGYSSGEEAKDVAALQALYDACDDLCNRSYTTSDLEPEK